MRTLEPLPCFLCTTWAAPGAGTRSPGRTAARDSRPSGKLPSRDGRTLTPLGGENAAISLLLKSIYCTINPLYYCTINPLYYCTINPLYYCTINPLYYCTINPLYYCTINPLYYCTINPLYYCTINPLYYCTINLLYYCTINLLYYCTINLLHYQSTVQQLESDNCS